MGTCCSMLNPTEEGMRQNLLNKKIKAEKKRTRKDKVHKLLLLGAGGSGKSTFFKQLNCIYGTGIQIEDKENKFLKIIHSNVIVGMETLLLKYEFYSKRQRSRRRKSAAMNIPLIEPMAKENEKFADFINNFNVDDFKDYFEEIKEAINSLWNDPCIKQLWSIRSKFYIPDSAEHFFNKVDKICEKYYLPDDEDCLLSRYQTTGIVEQTFEVDGEHKFQVFDVGGQRNERKKWIHCFESVTAVIFIASIAAYDMTLSEDKNTNRMEEALDLFSQICNGRWFKHTAMILFLNKIDLFKQKIVNTPITVCFPDYKAEPNDEKKSRRFIAEKFVSRRADEDKKLYIHFTCAINKNLTKKIFRDVQHVIITNNLEKAALL